MKTLKPAFSLNCVKIKVDNLKETLPRKDFRTLASYQFILASIKTLGIVQPIIVSKLAGEKYQILDGHIRFYALKELGQQYIYCIVSTDNERYTFDAQINGLSTFQRIGMIKKVIDSGITLSRIAETLGISEEKLRTELDATNGIDKEVVDILKTANVSRCALQALKKVKPLRQIEIAEKMVAMAKYSAQFVHGLVSASNENMIISQKYKKNIISNFNEIGALESESNNLLKKVKEAEEKYSTQIYELTIICGYINKLLANSNIDGYIQRNFSESYARLKKISKMDKNLLEEFDEN